ncbi:ADP-ribosylglycohydrolase family protein [Luteolibacter soli]|uniref:ADP-ribosylglycohydrolase family protein n=1 Tax=Luteolibacter soli TaxID=3135280 RepID=A0ABU9AUG7_9BACT
MTPTERAIESIQGLSVGDALGQCFFSLQADLEERVLRGDYLPEAPWHYTDDTEMSLSVLSMLLNLGRIDQDALAMSFAHGYSYDRAYGPAMHRALMRIREGEHWRSVAYSLFEGQGSYGNGAAMRAAPIGAYFAGSDDLVRHHAALAAEVTHAHPEGIAGAIAVAVAASVACDLRAAGRPACHEDFLNRVAELVPESEVRSRLFKAREMSSVGSIQFPVSVLGAGHEMSAQDTVPFALWCCGQSLGDFEKAIRLGLLGGVDRDTICAIIGGVVTCYTGSAAIPEEWIKRREPLPE